MSADGKRALVTGGSGAIGAAICRRLARAGHYVYVHCHRATEAAAACLDHARDVLGVRRLTALINPANWPSRRVAEKIGLAHERDAISRTGTPVALYAAAL